MNKCIKHVSILIILMAFAAFGVATAAGQPASINELTNSTYEETYITWTWTDPKDANFSEVMVYIDDDFKESVSKGVEYYTATGLNPNTGYEIGTRTVDTSGNVNTAWENHTAKTKPSADTTPPSSINELKNSTYEETYITWTWTDPKDADFSNVTVYIDDDFMGNVSKGVEYYNATELDPGEEYEIRTRTVDTSGNVDTDWETHIAWTKPKSSVDTKPPASVTTLENSTYEETYITWTWNDPDDADFSKVMVYIDGDFEENVTEGDEYYNATELDPNTKYEIGTRTVDTSGNVNTEWKNHTARTKPSSGYSTGNRIWEDGMDTTYLWTAETFTGFYYDLDEGESTETLTITGIKENLEEESIEYVTETTLVEFDCSDWGEYNVIGFMAEKYFAGYEEGETDEITDETISLVSDEMLSKVLIDEDDKHMLSTGASLELEEEYELKIIQLDLNGDKAQIELLRDGKSVDTDIISGTPSTYVYTRDIGSVEDVPLVAILVDSVFAGTESDMLVIEGIFQISEDYTSVEDGDTYGEMEVKSTSSKKITMTNEEDISLDEGDIVDLMGDIKFLVADDDDTLRFALYKEITTPGTYDIRGTVYNTTDAPTWTPMNFEGFYYDIDEDLGTEKLEVKNTGTSIEEGNLVYTTEVQSVEFDCDDWGKYNVIGFAAEKYFAGYNDKTDEDITDDSISLVSDEMLSKVLIDEDNKHTVSTGASLELEEGYELKIIQLDLDGDQAQIELLQNGKSVDTGIISSTPSTYVYTRDIENVDDVPVVAIYVDSVFGGTESDMLVIEGIFQISEDYTSVEDGDTYGEMEVKTTSDTEIIMRNEDDIDLDEGGKTMIMENVGFMTSEDGDRYTLFVRRTVGSIAALTIELPESLIVDEEIVITITADGDPVEGAEVQFAGENLGLTDSDGKVRFTSEETGTFTITAIKENYDSASEEIRILTEDEADMDPLEIEMPDTVEPGDAVIIKVTYEGDAIADASIAWDGEYIGDTDETGSITYTEEDAGTYTVTANKDGYLEGSEEIEVAYPSAEFELTGFTIPTEISANKKFTVSVDVTNTGDDTGTYLAELKVNDTVVDSQNVTLDVGETEKIEFTTKIAEAGTVTIGIGTESEEVTVMQSKSNMALIVAVLILLALLVAIGYLLISSAPEDGWTVEKLSEAIKDKFRGGKGL